MFIFLLVIKRKWYTSTEQQPNDTQMQIHQFPKGGSNPPEHHAMFT